MKIIFSLATRTNSTTDCCTTGKNQKHCKLDLRIYRISSPIYLVYKTH
jgi:hypothetical protein